MDNTLKNRLEQELDSVTTASDYGMLLTILSQKLGKPIDELRKVDGLISNGRKHLERKNT